MIEVGHVPLAQQLISVRFLNDQNPSERELGIVCGLTLIEDCDEVWVYTA